MQTLESKDALERKELSETQQAIQRLSSSPQGATPMGKAILADKQKKLRDLLGRVEKNSREKFSLQEKYLKYQEERQSGSQSKEELAFDKELKSAADKGVQLEGEEFDLPLTEKKKLLRQKVAEKKNQPKESPETTRQSIALTMANELIPQLRENLEKLDDKIPLIGGTGRLGGNISRAVNYTTGNIAEFNEYNKRVKSTAQAVGRAFEGRMTNEDFDRFLSLFPTPISSKKEREYSFIAMKNFIEAFEKSKDNVLKGDSIDKMIGNKFNTTSQQSSEYGRTDSNTSENDKKYQEFLKLTGRA
jgi:glycogen debranching enzyme